MIKKLVIAVFLLALGGVLTYYGLGHHFIKTKEKAVVVPKAQMALAETFVDIRDWEAADFTEHPRVAKALIDNGHAEVIPQQAAGKLGDQIRDAFLGGGDE